MTGTLDFPALFSYNTTIGNDGTKYPGHARLKRACGWCEKAAAAPVNTSPSPVSYTHLYVNNYFYFKLSLIDRFGVLDIAVLLKRPNKACLLYTSPMGCKKGEAAR